MKLKRASVTPALNLNNVELMESPGRDVVRKIIGGNVLAKVDAAPLEVEVKAPVNLSDARECLRVLGGVLEKTKFSETMYFDFPDGCITGHFETVRVRQSDGKFRLDYKKWGSGGDTKSMREFSQHVGDDVVERLEALGLKVTDVVRKTRETYAYRGLKVSLDDVEGLGGYVEVESKTAADRDKIFHVMEELGVRRESCLTSGYRSLIRGDNSSD